MKDPKENTPSCVHSFMIRTSLFLFSTLTLTLTLFTPIATAATTTVRHTQGDSKTITQRWQDAYWQSKKGITQLDFNAHWQSSDQGFIFKQENQNGWTFQLCHPKTGTTEEAFQHQQMASSLKSLLGRDFNANQLPLNHLHVDRSHTQTIRFKVAKIWILSENGKLSKSEPPKPKQSPSNTETSVKTNWRSEISPDGKWRAFVKNGAVFLKAQNSNKEINGTSPIGTPAPKAHYQGSPIWNATSTHFYVSHLEPGQHRTVTLVESTPKDQLQPKTHTIRYDKPGDKIDRVEPHLFSIDGSACKKPNRKLTKNAFNISHVGWDQSGKELRYEFIERGYGKHYLIAMNADTGHERLICKEESNTFIFIGGVRYRKDLHNTSEIIWGSERDGRRHLYLIDAATGKVKHRITQGDWVVRSIQKVDVPKRQITFTASGHNKGEDPYHIHWYRVNFDGSQLTPLTQADGTHKVTFSPKGTYYIDRWSRVDHPPVYELHRSSDGKKIKELARADASKFLQQGRRFPERFHCKDRNGRFDIWGIIRTPPNFDPLKKYPIIENIYAGPHGAFVPKTFSPWNSHASELAEEGFIVVNIDGLGTNYRHHDFSHFSYKNLADAGFPDRIKWIKKAAQSRPYMDVSRVGIYGGSAGGQSSTGAVLFHGDFYKAAVSDCGCHDNRMDKIWWNEQWMDWPIGKHYEKQSNVTNAHKLTGALMLTVGELDKNVDPASTLQVVDALIKADKDFEYYILPGGGHGSGERGYLRRKRYEFFRKHLGTPQ